LTVTPPALVACDVDGTLFDENETITPRTRDAVWAAVEAGARFVLATGRPPRWIRPVVEQLGFTPMAVCANGAVIYDSTNDHVVSARTLPVDTLAELAEIAARAIPGVGLAVERIGKRAHDTATPQFVSSPGYEHAWLNPDNTEVSIDDLLSAPAIKLLIRKAGARSADMAAELAKHIGIEGDITYSTNNVLAFGDMPNDLPMLLWAGHGVAMGNAHPDVLAAADEVTAPNSDDGVGRVLERWWARG
jgi:hydroxymethylpyrimidine pyrophosphatase-like HAD family hydrolase